MPVVIVIGLCIVGFFWLLYKITTGMKRDKDAMQIGPYNAWSPPPPSPPFPPGHPEDEERGRNT